MQSEETLKLVISTQTELIRAYDFKAQIYIVAFFVLIEGVFQLWSNLAPGLDITVPLLASAVALAVAYQFMRVIAPASPGRFGADMDTIMYVAQPRPSGFEAFCAQAQAGGDRDLLLRECFKLHLIRAKKERRYKRAEFIARCFLGLSILAFLTVAALRNLDPATVERLPDFLRRLAAVLAPPS